MRHPRSTTASKRRTPPTVKGARAFALHVLEAVEVGRVSIDEATERWLHRSGLSSLDRALAVELTYGVLRHQGTLDWRLEFLLDRALPRLPSMIRIGLRLGAYQLLHLERVPAHAALHETVQLIKGLKGTYWANFTNAVLRSLQRAPGPPWPDPSEHPVAALTTRYACPAWVVERWLERYGYAAAERLCRQTTGIPPLTLRTNTLRCSRETLQSLLLESGLPVHPTTISPVGLIAEKAGAPNEFPYFREGYYYVEDEAAQLVPPLLDPQPGERILDACAAPGGKTTHLAMLMKNCGEIVALDPSAKRLRLVVDNCVRLGIRIVTPQRGHASEENVPFGDDRRLFDRILVDAPCSGLGVLRRHPDGKWHKSASLVARCAATQRRILDHVGRLLRVGGVLVYSVCSPEPEETVDVIEHFCAEHPEFHRERVSPFLPLLGSALLTKEEDLSTIFNEADMDWFFAARLRKVRL